QSRAKWTGAQGPRKLPRPRMSRMDIFLAAPRAEAVRCRAVQVRYRRSDLRSRMLLNQSRGQQGDHQFVVARDRVPFAPRYRVRTLDHVDAWPVVLEKIEVRRDKASQRMSEIPRRRHRFEEDLGQQYRRSHVEIDASAI